MGAVREKKMSTAVDTGVDPLVAEPAADSASADVQTDAVSAEKGPDEFTSKLKAGGDFAVEQVKAAQRELSRMKAKLGSVESVVDAVGGSEALMGHLRRLNGLVSNPKMRDLVEQFERTGDVTVQANGAATPTEEFEEPWDPKIKPIVSEVSTLKAELGKLRGERGVEKVRGFFQGFFDEFPLPADDRKAMAAKLLEQTKQWATTEQGRQALEGMNDQTFRSLALNSLTKEQIRSALRQEEQALQARKAAAATDSPARGTTGQAKAVPGSVLDAFKQAARELGIDEHGTLL
jgi:uncharacterized protein YjiS (DUF1127 family)